MSPICITCGTVKQDPITGFCINDHDNWLEPNDELQYFEKAIKNLGVNIGEIRRAMETDSDIIINKSTGEKYNA